MSNYPFLVTSLNRLFQRWLKNPPSPGKVPHLGALNFPSSPAPQNEVSTSRINGDFVYFIFHHLWLVIFWERVYASPIPTGWLHPPFESTDGAHRLVYGLSYWWLIYILILSYHRNHQNPRNTWHINRITLGCFLMIPDDLRRHRGYECIQAPYFAGAQLAHFAEQGVVQTIFGPPGLLLYGHSAAQTWGWVVWGYHEYYSRWSCQRGSHFLLVFESDSLGITGKSLH